MFTTHTVYLSILLFPLFIFLEVLQSGEKEKRERKEGHRLTLSRGRQLTLRYDGFSWSEQLT
jgi:hypothetical protein